jgi:peptide/nickel transport system permease protein
MLTYLIRKFFLTLSIIFGVMLLTFLLFNVAARDPVRAFGGKQMKESDRIRLTHELGLDKPRFVLNFPEYHSTGKILDLLDTQFFNILSFHFPRSQRYQESVWTLFARKAPISFAVQGPAFVIGLGLQLIIAMIVAARRNSLIDYSATFLAVLMMSVPTLSIYLGAQWLFGAQLRWFPVAGWAPGIILAIHFAALPILITVIGGLGGAVRFYRTVALEEMNTDYIRTARAKGVSTTDVLLVHVFRNLLIPVVTNTIVALPFLLTGALLLEQMFQIPGFGGLLVDAIHATDSPVVMAEVYLTAIAYAVMLFITDICYTLVDPRVVLR